MADAQVPETVDEVTPGWLTDALHASGALDPDARVAAVVAEPVGLGLGVMALLYRLTATYDPPDAGPATLVVKLASRHEPTRAVARGYRFYEREATFYRDLASSTALAAPRAHAAAYDAERGDFVVLMEDLGGRRVCDQLEGCSPADAHAVVAALARMHAQWWGSPRLLEHSFIESPSDPPYPEFNARQGTDAWAGCLEAVGDLVPGRLRFLGDRWAEIGPALMIASGQRPWTLTHGDVRLDNLFFGADPSDLVAVDWQIAFRSPGASDVAYFLSQSLPVEERRSLEDDLLAEYLEGLRAGGVDGYGADELRVDYRRAILFCFTYPMTAAGQLDLVNDRAVALVRSMMQRCVAAIEDLDATELVPS